MAFTYNKLWKLLEDRQITRSELREKIGASQTTIVRMGKGCNVTLDVIDRICEALECSPNDILDYIPNSIEQCESIIDKELCSISITNLTVGQIVDLIFLRLENKT